VCVIYNFLIVQVVHLYYLILDGSDHLSVDEDHGRQKRARFDTYLNDSEKAWFPWPSKIVRDE
jgi:hypothetical protein